MSIVLFALPALARASTTLQAADVLGQTSGSNVSLITLYTQLIKLLQQEVIALEPTLTIAASSTSAMSSSSPSWLDDFNERAPRGYTPGFGGGGSAPATTPTPSPAPTPAPYVAKAVDFDGATYLSRNSGLSVANGSKGFFSFWIKAARMLLQARAIDYVATDGAGNIATFTRALQASRNSSGRTDFPRPATSAL